MRSLVDQKSPDEFVILGVVKLLHTDLLEGDEGGCEGRCEGLDVGLFQRTAAAASETATTKFSDFVFVNS